MELLRKIAHTAVAWVEETARQLEADRLFQEYLAKTDDELAELKF